MFGGFGRKEKLGTRMQFAFGFLFWMGACERDQTSHVWNLALRPWGPCNLYPLVFLLNVSLVVMQVVL